MFALKFATLQANVLYLEKVFLKMAAGPDAAKKEWNAHTSVKLLVIQAKNVQTYRVKLKCVCFVNVVTGGFKSFASL